MLSVETARNSALNEILSFTYPKLHTGSCWFISFYAFDPAKGEMRRKRIKINSVGNASQRRRYAAQVVIVFLRNLKRGGIRGWKLRRIIPINYFRMYWCTTEITSGSCRMTVFSENRPYMAIIVRRVSWNAGMRNKHRPFVMSISSTVRFVCAFWITSMLNGAIRRLRATTIWRFSGSSRHFWFNTYI